MNFMLQTTHFILYKLWVPLRIFKNGEDRSNEQPSQRWLVRICRVNWRGETTARCEIRKPCLGTAVEKKESGRSISAREKNYLGNLFLQKREGKRNSWSSNLEVLIH